MKMHEGMIGTLFMRDSKYVYARSNLFVALKTQFCGISDSVKISGGSGVRVGVLRTTYQKMLYSFLRSSETNPSKFEVGSDDQITGFSFVMFASQHFNKLQFPFV